jgi:acetyltransferase-like isoleucine patch superfamily enzyme
MSMLYRGDFSRRDTVYGGQHHVVTHIRKDQTTRSTLTQRRSSSLRIYRDMTVGERGFGAFLVYELMTFCLGSLPGGLGLALRTVFYKRLFKAAGKGLVIGRNVTVRHPGRIVMGKNVTIDDNALVDARGAGTGEFRLGDEVIVNRNCMLKAKTGTIRVGSRTNVGSNSLIVSYTGVTIGESVLIAGGCFLNGGGYPVDDTTRPMAEQGVVSAGPITIGNDVWIGTGAIVLDGVTIGDHAVVGAGAVVRRDVAQYDIVAGVPARVLRSRRP